MNKQPPAPTITTHIHHASGVLASLGIAVMAELFFSAFLPSEDSLMAASRIAVVFLSLFTLHRFALTSLKSYRQSGKDLTCFAVIIIGSILVIWLGHILSLGLSSYASSTKYLKGVGTEALYFAIPYASGALLIQAVLGLQHGLLFSLNLALITSLYIPGKPLYAVMVAASCLVACLSLQRLRSRSTYMRASVNIALICLPFALASIIIDPNLPPAEIAIRLAGPLVGGLLCAFIASGLTPVVEYIGGYVTDMRLLEMATLDHPLLKELSIQAPGTWNHSMVMGMMVEAAADATGANAVLARVSAYFHDIGKTKKPMYFVENQLPGENRHDKLSPSMSALIIKAHVKDGVELSRKHKLPKAIEDMIYQHHGTALIEYFYDKANTELEESGEVGEVDESLYRYPGPRPQSREAGILMLADGIEAAARTISEPSFDRIQGLVQKMINKVFASGELNECDLTLADLHIIAKCFTRVLAAIYHQRIAYAEPAEKTNEKEELEENAPSGSDSQLLDVAGTPSPKKLKIAGEERSGKETPRENLKRLGL